MFSASLRSSAGLFFAALLSTPKTEPRESDLPMAVRNAFDFNK